ncbi:MAG: (2Fe-2S)-binding protein [Oscillochloridaceae bacterium]|nr:(2Fe-2S)-binding protein [Chloroflexaceae bacterium]MDW8390728.1 (2Fe-2S)-binding protein [Oscillochloridaceae bacterium]
MDLTINDQTYQVADDPPRVLLWVLRDELGLTGTKFGCGAGYCGACTVHLDGVAVRSCLTPLRQAAGKKVTTIEGLARGEVLHPVQRAFLEVQAPQCGWCMSGQMMAAAALIAANPDPSDEEITAAMEGNFCRCGAYVRIRRAVARAAVLARSPGEAA